MGISICIHDLDGPALDLVVGHIVCPTILKARNAAGLIGPFLRMGSGWYERDIPFSPSKRYSQGMPYLEARGIALERIVLASGNVWRATSDTTFAEAPTLLVAGMRCLVKAEYGLYVNIPDTFLGL